MSSQGYDPVSYFMEDEPREGKKSIRYHYKGVTYYFENEDHQAVFKENPIHFEPEYGGWCAYATGDDGTKVKIDPETYKIIDDKLYLFYHTFWVNTLPKWNKDQDLLKTQADQNWGKLLSNKK